MLCMIRIQPVPPSSKYFAKQKLPHYKHQSNSIHRDESLFAVPPYFAANAASGKG